MGSNKEATSSKSDPVKEVAANEVPVKEAPKKSSGFFQISIIWVILALFIAYQINANQRIDAQLAQLQSTVGDLVVLVQKESTPEDNAPKDFERVTKKDDHGHPHSKYKIVPSKHDPNVPADPDREYTYDDFDSVFGVKPLHHVVISPEAKEVLKGHDLKTDPKYAEYYDEIKEDLAKYGHLMDKSSEKFQRDTMVVKWFSPIRGFGILAKKDIKKHTFLGVYTGVIRKDIKNKDYTWTYYTRHVIKNGTKVRAKLGTDGLEQVYLLIGWVFEVCQSCRY